MDCLHHIETNNTYPSISDEDVGRRCRGRGGTEQIAGTTRAPQEVRGDWSRGNLHLRNRARQRKVRRGTTPRVRSRRTARGARWRGSTVGLDTAESASYNAAQASGKMQLALRLTEVLFHAPGSDRREEKPPRSGGPPHRAARRSQTVPWGASGCHEQAS